MRPNSYYRGKPLPEFIDSRAKLLTFSAACYKRLHKGTAGLLYLCNVAREFNPCYYEARHQRELMTGFVLSLGIKGDGSGFNGKHLPLWFPDYYRMDSNIVCRANEARLWLLADILCRALWAEDVTSDADTTG